MKIRAIIYVTFFELVLIHQSIEQSECEDKIPSTCNTPSSLNSCSKIIAFARRYDVEADDVCNAPWKMIDQEIDDISCSSNTNGRFKDTCKISCNQCEGETCRDISPQGKCNRWKRKGRCSKNWAKKKCRKTCGECNDDDDDQTTEQRLKQLSYLQPDLLHYHQ